MSLLYTRNCWWSLEFSQLRCNYFTSTEEDYCLKGMHFAICRSRQHHSLYWKLAFQCSSSLKETFFECTRTSTCLGHFQTLGPLFKLNIMSPYWPNDISKSKNAKKQRTKRHKSRSGGLWTRIISVLPSSWEWKRLTSISSPEWVRCSTSTPGYKRLFGNLIGCSPFCTVTSFLAWQTAAACQSSR